MPQRRVLIPEIGEVILSRRRGAKNLRLSVTAKGQVRVSMPSWTPYAVGISFATNRRDWLLKQLGEYSERALGEGMAIGKAHRLRFIRSANSRTSARVTAEAVEVATNLPFSSKAVQDKARSAAERALRAEASHLLPQRLEILASQHGFTYKAVRVRKLTSRWGSCSQDATITLSYFLIQLPWELIDYVLLHELVHTRYLNHGADFWRAFESILPDAKRRRKVMRGHKPRLEPM
jgi:predicted metal-dependent hydrolase